jgi:hypothetical protein
LANKSKGASEKFTSTPDWAWKKTYFTAVPFFDLLENLGFTDAELEEFYKKNPESFRSVAPTEQGLDSSFIPAFESVKRVAADLLFIEKYTPDPVFLARFEGETDSAAIKEYWLSYVRSNPADFYMRQIIKEETGEAYTDSSLQQIYGEGKPITAADVEVIRSWVPESRKNMRIKDLVEWLYKWKMFAQRSEKMGLTNSQEYKDMIHWAQRIEQANVYLAEAANTFTGQLEFSESDTALARLIIADNTGRADEPSEASLLNEIGNIGKTRVSAKIDSVISNIRKGAKITFLNDEYKDERDSDPATVLAKADSLRDIAADDGYTGDPEILDEAERLYRLLSFDFAFTPQGRKAMGELAKIQIDKYNSGPRPERYMISSAVNSYRRTQMLDTDAENLCNSYFMVGFAYDEYLKTFALAEANYKWILRFSPACALVSDAEFMLQHLGEPMASIEEIQGQSIRQGRKIDFDDDIAIDEEGEETPVDADKAGTPAVGTL